MPLYNFTLPDLGEGVTEGEIVKWLVKAGDVIKEDAPLVDVMTDKATVTVPSPKAGTVLRTHGNLGDMAKVHHPLVDMEIEGAVPKAAASSHGISQAVTPSAGTAKVPSAIPGGAGEKILATPVTRRMAKEHNIDLSNIEGTGPQGRVLKSDVEAHLSGSSATGSKPAASTSAHVKTVHIFAPLTSSAQDERIPLTGLRKKIAEKMVKSKFTAPHYAFIEEVDATALIELRNRINDSLSKEGVKISFLPFFVKAVVAAFRKFPQVNSVMDEAQQTQIIRGERNIGIAAMTEKGLTVPVVKNADRHSIRSLGNEISRLGAAARDQKLKMDELTNGTFTITSLGNIGGLFATPILNHPEVGIMGVHKMRKVAKPGATDGSVVFKDVMLFSFCFDHRVIDGATGAEFAYEVIKHVEKPELLLVDMV
jgi:pyruvate dehydrogenase E2 component (dihydrolipoamide acetyltransferase)